MKKFLRTFCGFFLVGAGAALPFAPAIADVKAGVDAWSDGNYEAALKEWRPLAAAGDPDALFNLAQAYKLGRGVPEDLKKAEELYGKAAAKGHVQASDIYGLLLFQNGQRAKAMPYIEASAARGEPRAQYLLGLALFNGDNVGKDWVRAYALVSLAQQTGLPQAASALPQMDQHIPLEDRQKSVILATRLAAEAQATRDRQLAAAELGDGTIAPVTDASSRAPEIISAERAVSEAIRAAGTASPAAAGADFTRKALPPATAAARPAPKPAPRPAASPVPTAPATGPWRVQLGAFGVSGNADKLWARVGSRPELAGHGKMLVPSGRLTKLQAGGFASKADADAACSRLSAAGYACLPVRD